MRDNAVTLEDASVYTQCAYLSEDDVAFLRAIEGQIPIVADISRADILLCSWQPGQPCLVLAHAQPHSVAAVHTRSMAGQLLDDSVCWKLAHLLFGCETHNRQSFTSDGAPIVVQVYPVWRPGTRHIIATLRIETNLLEHERQRRRSHVFQRVTVQLQRMAQYGRLVGADMLSPFGESDGIIVVDRTRTIRYVSGVAMNLYRRIGYLGDLVGRPLSNLATQDDALVRAAMTQQRCLEQNEEVGGHAWVKKALPLWDMSPPLWRRLVTGPQGEEISHVILVVSDITAERRREQELRVKTALIQELHHRVKNNLQTIAALLRMQARRAGSSEARQTIEEAVNRILSVAVIHEFLSRQEARMINMREVGSRIITQVQQGLVAPDKHITFGIEGPPIYLPSRQATACALVLNELLQNALEHGFEERTMGHIQVILENGGDQVIMRVRDNGSGLPTDFDLSEAESRSLGLYIVRTLVQEDLKGVLEIYNRDGVEAVVTFPKSILGGEQ
ncbi:MAG: histidine kinase N-terminal domain-containing protein [Anaerolineae bacterium]